MIDIHSVSAAVKLINIHVEIMAADLRFSRKPKSIFSCGVKGSHVSHIRQSVKEY